MDIGENIKAVREHHNMSQSDFAKLLNMTASAVSAWELGTREPRIKNLRQIADLFQIPMSELMNGDVETYYKAKKSPASAAAETRELTREELIDILMRLRILRSPTDTLSDADLKFLMHVISVLDDWFSQRE